MAKVIAVSDVGHEILCKVADALVISKMQGGKKTVMLDMDAYNQTQLVKLSNALQKTLTISH